MAQERFWNWQDDDSTGRMNQRDLILIPQGLYSGFDAALAAGLTLNLVHTVDNKKKRKNDLSLSNALGIWKSQQGCIIVEDAAINLTVAAGNATHPRIDLIVGRHKYIATVGGSLATYSIVQGTPAANPVAPSLPVPDEQVILGTLYVPANMTNLNGTGVVYTKSVAPDFGDSNNIVHKTFAENISGLKGFERFFYKDQGTAVYDDNFLAIVLQGSVLSNRYEIAPFGLADYQFTENIMFNGYIPIGFPIHFTSLQKLDIINETINAVGNGIIAKNGQSYMRIEPNEVFTAICIGGTAPNYTFRLVKGSEAVLWGRNKFFELQQNQFYTVPIVPTNDGKLTLPALGNTFVIKPQSGGFSSINWLPDWTTQNGGSDTGGTEITLIVDDTAVEGQLNHMYNVTFGGSIPVGYKPIHSSTKNDAGNYTVIGNSWHGTSLKAGTIIRLVEYYNFWKVVSVQRPSSTGFNFGKDTVNLFSRSQIVQQQAGNINISAGLIGGYLDLPDTGNSFQIYAGSASIVIKDIRLNTFGATVSYPIGSILHLEFAAADRVELAYQNDPVWAGNFFNPDYIDTVYNRITKFKPAPNVFGAVTLYRSANGWRIIGAEDLIRRTNIEPWNTVSSFGSNWQQFSGGGTVRYRLEGNNKVHLSGYAQHAASGTNNVIFTLPSGYRPIADRAFTCPNNANNSDWTVIVGANGDVSAFNTVAVNNIAVALDGVHFFID